MARALVVAPVLMLLSILAGSAQGDVNGIRGRLEKRFEVLPIANGVVLTPRFRTTSCDRSVRLDDRDRRRAGDRRRAAEAAGQDADVVLQLSYLDPQARRSLAGTRGQTPVPPADAGASRRARPPIPMSTPHETTPCTARAHSRGNRPNRRQRDC